MDALTLAIYFYKKKLSISNAASKFGIRRRVHTHHRDFALELVAELKSLQAGNPPNSPFYLEKLKADGGVGGDTVKNP